MSNRFPPVHLFQPHVERLRQEFAAAGTPKTHAELLQLVAVAEGASSWDWLQQAPKRGWLARKLGWGSHWRRQSVVYRDELLFDLQLGHMCLGVEAEWKDRSHVRITADEGWLRRGMLIVGPQGWGATTALEHYEAQQLARGAGLLVLDASPNYETASKLQRIAEGAGRTDFRHYRHDLAEGERLADVQGLLKSRGAAYVNLPWDCRSDAATGEGELFVRQLLEHARLEGAASSRPWPFMVVVPEGGWLLTQAWLPLVQYARQLGIMLVVRLHSLAEMQGFVPGMSDALFNLIGTQMYLAPRGEAAVQATAQALEPGQAEEQLAETRKRLGEMGMGEALVRRWQERPKHVRLCMLVPETREEDHAKRQAT